MASITVVIAAFDAGDGLARSLDAVRAQDGVELEVIVVDDGSTDGTAQVADAVAAADPRVRVVHQPNRGVSAARNAGLAAARSPWVTFLDCDDVPAPGWLVRFVELLDAAPGAAVAFVGATYRDADGRATEVVAPAAHGPAFHGLESLWLTGTMAARTDLLRRVGGFTVGLAYSENTELGLRLADALHRHGQRAAATGESLVDLFDPGGSGSRAYSDRMRVASAAYIVRRHHALLHREPRLLGIYYSMLGVSTARLGDPGSVGWFAKAVVADPRQPRHLGRLLAALIPPLRHRLWPPR